MTERCETRQFRGGLLFFEARLSTSVKTPDLFLVDKERLVCTSHDLATKNNEFSSLQHPVSGCPDLPSARIFSDYCGLSLKSVSMSTSGLTSQAPCLSLSPQPDRLHPVSTDLCRHFVVFCTGTRFFLSSWHSFLPRIFHQDDLRMFFCRALPSSLCACRRGNVKRTGERRGYVRV